MTTIDDLQLEESGDVQMTIKDILDDFKDMINYALTVAKKCLAGATLLTLMAFSQEGITRNVIIDESIPIVELKKLPIQEKPVYLQVVAENASRKKLDYEIEQLASLEDGWDGEIASRPSKKALSNIRVLVQQLDDKFLERCSLFASNDSGVYLQGRLNNGKMTIFVNDVKMAYVVKNKLSKLSGTMPFRLEAISYLNEGLSQYV